MSAKFNLKSHHFYVVQGKLVYANQGKVSDYQELNATLGSLAGTIAIVRYGGAGRADKVSKPQNSITHQMHHHISSKQTFLDIKLYPANRNMYKWTPVITLGCSISPSVCYLQIPHQSCSPSHSCYQSEKVKATFPHAGGTGNPLLYLLTFHLFCIYKLAQAHNRTVSLWLRGERVRPSYHDQFSSCSRLQMAGIRSCYLLMRIFCVHTLKCKSWPLSNFLLYLLTFRVHSDDVAHQVQL